jgi:SAM-dependent methyltransferase
MHINYEFVLDYCSTHCRTGKILDYGCGGGEVVAEGIRRGLDMWGTDVFYAGSPLSHGAAEATGELGKHIFPMKDGAMPFPSATFDLVFHNQVFEHVPNMDLVLNEIHRVLKPSGFMLSLFPSREVWREGHCGIPLAHRFDSSSWLWFWRRVGLGKHHGNKSPEKWAADFKQWLHDWCHYRPRREIILRYAAAGFSFEPVEMDYIRFRMGKTGRSRMIPAATAAAGLTVFAFRRLGGMVVVSHCQHGIRERNC